MSHRKEKEAIKLREKNAALADKRPSIVVEGTEYFPNSIERTGERKGISLLELTFKSRNGPVFGFWDIHLLIETNNGRVTDMAVFQRTPEEEENFLRVKAGLEPKKLSPRCSRELTLKESLAALEDERLKRPHRYTEAFPKEIQNQHPDIESNPDAEHQHPDVDVPGA